MRPALILTLLALAACDSPARVAYRPMPPPPPVLTETISKPPVSGVVLIWQPGHWDWDGAGSYFWRAGDWVDREGHGTQWQDGYWGVVDGRMAWVAAHWV